MAKLAGKQAKPSAPETKKPERKSISVDGQNLYLKINNYSNGKLAMCLDLEKEDGTPYATISKCFGNFYRDETFVPNCSTFIDTNNCPQFMLQPVFEALDAHPRTVFGSPYTIQSGFCEYPIYDFNPKKLEEYDPEGFKAYQKEYSENFSIEQRNLSVAMFGGDFSDDFDDEFNA
jgi:hypothetical protein